MKTRSSFRLSLLLRLIYALLWVLSRIATRIFFRRLLVLGKSCFWQPKGPVIMAINHPNTLIDVLLPGTYFSRILFFLANYGLFRHPVSNWLLTRLYCIPIKRGEDMKEGEIRNNDSAFEQSFRHLEQNGALLIAPEGVSWTDRFVRPFKTGTARIALGIEARNDWQLGLQILPVGLSYSASRLFRSDVVMQAGPPIEVKDRAAQWQQDPDWAAETLTRHIEETIRALTIHTRDPEGDQLIGRLEAMLRLSRPLPQKAGFERAQALTHRYLDNQPLKQAVSAYYEALGQHELSDQAVFTNSRRGVFWRTMADTFLLTLGFPLFGVALFFWLPPCFLPWLLARRLKLYIGYDATIKMLTGLVLTFPIALWGLWHLSRPYLPHGAWYLAVLGGVVLLGLYAELYLDLLQRFIVRWQGGQLRGKALAGLKAQRAAIMGMLQG